MADEWADGLADRPRPPSLPRCPECGVVAGHKPHTPECSIGQAHAAHWGNVRAVEWALAEAIRERRQDRPFMERLRHRIEQDGAILDRLASDEHRHRYPQPNQLGFPVNQCLDCGAWVIAAPDLTPPPTERDS